MPFINFNNYRIHYQKKGKGSTIVLLHGFGMDSKIWENYLPYFEDYKVIQIDLPGFGQSQVIEKYSIKDIAQQVHAILEQEAIEQCILLGHSMGGYVALHFLEMYAHRLIGLGLIHSHPFEDLAATKITRTKAAAFILKNGNQIFLKQLYQKIFADNKKFQYLIAEMLEYYSKNISPQSLAAGMLAMRDRKDQSQLLKTTAIPIFQLIGKKDEAIPTALNLRQVTLPIISKISLYSDIGHMGMYEAPAITAQNILDFFHYCHNYKK